MQRSDDLIERITDASKVDKVFLPGVRGEILAFDWFSADLDDRAIARSGGGEAPMQAPRHSQTRCQLRGKHRLKTSPAGAG